MVNTVCYDLDDKPIRRFYQWDKGQVLVIKDMPLYPVPGVELFNNDYEGAVDAEVTIVEGKIHARISDDLLMRGEPLRGYIYRTPEQRHDTIGYIYIPVVERSRPSDDPVRDAEAFARESEAWAVGTKHGEPVPPDAPQYENNAKYYAEAAEAARLRWTEF